MVRGVDVDGGATKVAHGRSRWRRATAVEAGGVDGRAETSYRCRVSCSCQHDPSVTQRALVSCWPSPVVVHAGTTQPGPTNSPCRVIVARHGPSYPCCAIGTAQLPALVVG